MYKVVNGMAPEIMNEIFQLSKKSYYNLRYTTELITPPIHSVYHGRESASYSGPKLRELIPTVMRQIDTLSGFKKAIKNGNLPIALAGFAKHTCLTWVSYRSNTTVSLPCVTF